MLNKSEILKLQMRACNFSSCARKKSELLGLAKFIFGSIFGFIVMSFFLVPKIFAESVLTIEVTSSQVSALPVAIVPFAWNSFDVPSNDVALIIQEDLKRSGQFKVLSRADMLSRPSQVHQVSYRDWRIMGVEYLLIGQVEPELEGGNISFQILYIHQGTKV